MPWVPRNLENGPVRLWFFSWCSASVPSGAVFDPTPDLTVRIIYRRRVPKQQTTNTIHIHLPGYGCAVAVGGITGPYCARNSEVTGVTCGTSTSKRGETNLDSSHFLFCSSRIAKGVCSDPLLTLYLRTFGPRKLPSGRL